METISHPALAVNDLQLTATLPKEMVDAQTHLMNWCDKKIEACTLESQELKEATEHAKKMKWKFSTLQSQYYKAEKRVQYYTKIKEALLHGYYIVPNFPIQMFAIRTDKEKPKGHSWSYWGDFEQEAKELPIGQAEYKNPFPCIERINSVYDNVTKEEITKAESYPLWWENLEFPITMAKPIIMQATTRAMALKIFDQIGIMPAYKKEDPVIIGQIINKNGYTTKTVSFMIAWHLNTNVI